MTTTFINTATTAGLTTDGNDNIYISRFGSILTTDTGIDVDGTFNTIQIDGVLASDFFPIRVLDDNNGVTIGLTGQVVGLDEIRVSAFVDGDNNFILNQGSITGGGSFNFEGSGHNFTNHGVLASSFRDALGLVGSGHTVVNSGDITGATFGIESEADNVSITNSGTITGFGGTGIATTGVNSTVVNSGVVNGDVLMTGNGMTYQGRADGIVMGDVIGGDGEDSFTGASLEDSFFGEGGADDLRGRAGDDIVRGGADDDLVAGNQGDDRVDGNQGDDTLFGNRGDDIVRGGSGDDVISGGRGDDVLTGNSGRDVFVFNRRTDDDTITDFRNNFDQLDLTAYGVENVQALRDAGVFIANGAGSIVDLTAIGGDGVIYVEDMSVSDWTGADFIL